MELSAKSFASIRKAIFSGNIYNTTELAGAFGDLGTLIPFVVGYIVVNKLDPVGILVSFVPWGSPDCQGCSLTTDPYPWQCIITMFVSSVSS